MCLPSWHSIHCMLLASFGRNKMISSVMASVDHRTAKQYHGRLPSTINIIFLTQEGGLYDVQFYSEFRVERGG